MDAFDADVLIYAAAPVHPLGHGVRRLLIAGTADDAVGIGSVLLLPELLSQPIRRGADHEVEALAALLGRLDLLPVSRAVAELATVLGAEHRLRAADAVHLATAVDGGAERFVTNNRRDLRRPLPEIDIVHPDELADPDPPPTGGN